MGSRSLFSFLAAMQPGTFVHKTCRNAVYPGSDMTRFHVPDALVFWNVEFPEYNPVKYTSPAACGREWADPDLGIVSFHPKWNKLDGNVNRVSFHGDYKLVDGHPLNPIGRTGLVGRGLLGRWGPNHAADPIVTRWKRNELQEIIKNKDSGKSILQMVAIQRRDNRKWAIPGGMVDPGEKVTSTLKREFSEEALDCQENKSVIDEFFSNPIEIYKGYVDDYRNTDNAWIETVACNFHDEEGTKVGRFKLTAGDDAANVRWMDIDKSIELHANHAQIVEQVITLHNAHW